MGATIYRPVALNTQPRAIRKILLIAPKSRSKRMKILKIILTLPLLLLDPAYGLSKEDAEKIGVKLD